MTRIGDYCNEICGVGFDHGQRIHREFSSRCFFLFFFKCGEGLRRLMIFAQSEMKHQRTFMSSRTSRTLRREVGCGKV